MVFQNHIQPDVEPRRIVRRTVTNGDRYIHDLREQVDMG